jgi:NAD(P)-dependent dehydrogenase (short-subunit alcohol dehydrogenase family)
VARFGRIDALVNNASTAVLTPISFVRYGRDPGLQGIDRSGGLAI